MVMAHLNGCEEHIDASGITRYEAVVVVVGREANARRGCSSSKPRFKEAKEVNADREKGDERLAEAKTPQPSPPSLAFCTRLIDTTRGRAPIFN
jgi:hypothetical protein